MSGFRGSIGPGALWAMKHYRWWTERGRLEATLNPPKPAFPKRALPTPGMTVTGFPDGEPRTIVGVSR